MKCITEKEISQWLTNAGHDEKIAGSDSVKTTLIQFQAPDTYGAIENFMRCFFADIVIEGDMLIIVTDHEPEQESQLFVFNALRFHNDENRPIEQAPGFLIEAIEREKAVALFALVTSFGWKSYLYADHGKITLFNWEGEIFDVWISSEAKQLNLRRILNNFNLKEVESQST